MVGYRVGVITYLKKLNPWMINIHCTNHRLALAHKDLIKDFNYLEEFTNIVSLVYKYFSKSASKTNELIDSQLGKTHLTNEGN